MRSRRSAREDLRLAVDCLPRRTRVAMLEGIRSNDIIVGAYVDRKGGVCPMLAAHRCGGRTDFRSFARAWDRFTGAGRRARRATERELRTLTAHIEGSVWREAEMRSELVKPTPAPTLPRQAPRRRRYGGAWLRPFRRWDGYRDAIEAALQQDEQEREPERSIH